MTDRQTGCTTRQMLEAPIGAVYVWCNNTLTYPKVLAHGLQRDDLVVKPLSWLEPQNVCGRDFVGVVIDHAVPLGGWQVQDAMRYLRGHGVLVAVDSAHVRPTDPAAGGDKP